MPNQGTSEPGGVGAGHFDEFVAIREPTMNDLAAIAEMLREREDEATGSRVSDEIDRRISLIEDTLRRETMRRFFVAVLRDGRVVGMGGLQADAIAPDLITSDERPTRQSWFTFDRCTAGEESAKPSWRQLRGPPASSDTRRCS